MTVSRAEWERVRDGRDRLRKDLERVEEREVELMRQLFEHRARALRLRKQLRLAERRTDEAVVNELDSLEELEEAERVEAERVEASYLPEEEEPTVVVEEHSFFTDMLRMDPGDWAVIDGLDPFLNLPGPSGDASL